MNPKYNNNKNKFCCNSSITNSNEILHNKPDSIWIVTIKNEALEHGQVLIFVTKNL
jgi:hypothetical protein